MKNGPEALQVLLDELSFIIAFRHLGMLNTELYR
jgi:hypothetical protein